MGDERISNSWTKIGLQIILLFVYITAPLCENMALEIMLGFLYLAGIIYLEMLYS